MSDEMPLPLRPHHGMCLYFFKGEGYSKEFTENMWSIRKALIPGAFISSGGAHPVRLTLCTDGICAACPHNTDGTCDHDERVRRIDAAVLKACGLSEGMAMGFDELAGLITSRIFDAGLREEICGDCKWGYICGNVQRFLSEALYS